jgi:hypothetical protein
MSGFGNAGGGGGSLPTDPSFTTVTTTGAISSGGDLTVSRDASATTVHANVTNTNSTAGSTAQINLAAGSRSALLQQTATGQFRIQSASASIQMATSVGDHCRFVNDNSLRFTAVASTPAGSAGQASFYCDSSGNPFARVGTGRIIDIGALGLTATDVKTSAYTAAAGELVLVDPSAASADIAITLPATAANCAVMLVTSAAGPWNVTIGRNGNTVNGLTDTTRFSMRYEGQFAQFRPDSSGYIGQVINPPNAFPAYDFDGSTYYSIANSSAINITGALTISCWLYAQGTGSQIVYGGYDSSSPFSGYGLSVGGSGGADRIEFWDGSAWRAGGRAVRHRWTHVAAVHNGTNSVSIYIDGRRDATVVANALSSYTGTKALGASSDGASDFNGLLQDFRIYSSALTAANVRSIFNNGRGWPLNDFADLVAWYLGNEDTGSTAVDRVSANNGTVSGTAAWGPGIIRL